MRLPLEWLHEYCRPALSAAQLGERLTMTGTKQERLLHHGVYEPDSFVVGLVLGVEAHPDADRLSVCRVALGGDGEAQIVCGAPNVAAGQAVAVARPGAVLPDGQRLGAARLRGIVSEGMILSEDELGLGGGHSGILVLDGGLEPGTPLAGALPIATDVLELEITPNRPDCLGVYGLAREVHAATGAELEAPPWIDDPGSFEPDVAGVGVSVEAPELCPRFTARVFEGVRPGASPPWLKARLMAAGQRPISNVVDVTNYVMLLTGQPLHAFDLDRVAGGRLVVRRARAAETLRTLDGEARLLDGEMLVICDDEGASSLAGVMGGERSEVHAGTRRVLMESATWVGANIHRTSARLGLRSEASARFEKGLSPEGALEAQAVATRLMIDVCGARLVPGTIDVGGPGGEPRAIRLRPGRVAALLGAEIAAGRCAEILEALDFDVAGAADGELEVGVPHFRRHDVTREVDLIEEVARIDGVERLPATLPARRGATGTLSRAQRSRRRVEDVLVGRGLHETVGWSLTGPDLADRLRLGAEDPRRSVVALENPMSEDQSVMRPTLLGSLLDAARHNVAHGAADLGLFESGTVYRAAGDRTPEIGAGMATGAREWPALAVLLTGRLAPPSWREAGDVGGQADFFAAKALAEAVLGALRLPASIEPAVEPFLHPGRAASVSVAGRPAGWIGELHPLVGQAWELERTVAVWELDLGELVAATPEVATYRDLIGVPAVRQDLAVVVPEDAAAADVLMLVRGAAGELLESVQVFDVYRGEQIGAGRVSLALRCEFRAPDRTLTDVEVATVRDRITEALARELGGTLRA